MFSVNNMQIKLILSMLLLSLMIVTIPVHTKVKTTKDTITLNENTPGLILKIKLNFVGLEGSKSN